MKAEADQVLAAPVQVADEAAFQQIVAKGAAALKAA
jgi:hypothetical protein